MDANAIAQDLKRRYSGETFQTWTIKSQILNAVEELIEATSPVPEDLAVTCIRDHNTHRIEIYDYQSGSSSPVMTVVAHKKKGKVHHSWGGPYADYLVGEFEVELRSEGLKTSVDTAVDEVRRGIEARSEHLTALKTQYKQVMQLFGYTKPSQLKYWIDDAKKYFYTIFS